MLMYPDHLQNWLDCDHSLLIFLIVVLFWLSEMGQIWVSGHFGRALCIFLIMVPLWLKLIIFGVSGECVGVNVEEGAEAYLRFALHYVYLFEGSI